MTREVFGLRIVLVFLALLCALCSACGPKERVEPGFGLVQAQERKEMFKRMHPSRQGLDAWKDLARPIERSLDALQARDPDQVVLKTPQLEMTVADMQASLRHLLRVLPQLEEDPGVLAREFTCYKLRPAPLFTGYFEPRLSASLERMPGYPYPLYAPPKDLQSVDLGRFHPRWKGQRLIYRVEEGKAVPYHTRAEIDGGKALKDKAKVVAWAKNAMDVFFLHIQGSGQLQLPDGEQAFVGYAGKNGHEYVSLGRVLVDRGHMSYADVSMPSIRAYLRNHPELMPEILFTNPSYVFFRLREDGPYGAMGRVLTPMVSLATDPSVLPLGALLAMQVDLPGRASEDRLVGLGLAQDVGGAIQGRHVDLYCGSGPEAAGTAGRLKTRGQVWLMIAKSVLESD